MIIVIVIMLFLNKFEKQLFPQYTMVFKKLFEYIVNVFNELSRVYNHRVVNFNEFSTILI